MERKLNMFEREKYKRKEGNATYERKINEKKENVCVKK